MKILITFFLLSFGIFLKAQDTTSHYRPDSSEMAERRAAGSKMMAGHEFLTTYIGSTATTGMLYYQAFVQAYLYLQVNDNFKWKNLGNGQYSTSIESYDGLGRKLYMNMSVEKRGEDYFIKKCSFTGNKDLVIKFFVRYWGTDFHLELNPRPGEIAFRHFWGETAHFWVNDNKTVDIRIAKN